MDHSSWDRASPQRGKSSLAPDEMWKYFCHYWLLVTCTDWDRKWLSRLDCYLSYFAYNNTQRHQSQGKWSTYTPCSTSLHLAPEQLTPYSTSLHLAPQPLTPCNTSLHLVPDDSLWLSYQFLVVNWGVLVRMIIQSGLFQFAGDISTVFAVIKKWN